MKLPLMSFSVTRGSRVINTSYDFYQMMPRLLVGSPIPNLFAPLDTGFLDEAASPGRFQEACLLCHGASLMNNLILVIWMAMTLLAFGKAYKPGFSPMHKDEDINGTVYMWVGVHVCVYVCVGGVLAKNFF